MRLAARKANGHDCKQAGWKPEGYHRRSPLLLAAGLNTSLGTAYLFGAKFEKGPAPSRIR